jgi:hypothetical protein
VLYSCLILLFVAAVSGTATLGPTSTTVFASLAPGTPCLVPLATGTVRSTFAVITTGAFVSTNGASHGVLGEVDFAKQQNTSVTGFPRQNKALQR